MRIAKVDASTTGGPEPLSVVADLQDASTLREGKMTDEIRFRRQVEETGYSVLYHILTLDKGLSDQAFRLYSLLLKYAQQKDHAYPGVKRLAEDLGKSEVSVSRALAELRERGLISRQRRFGTSTITWIEDPNQVYGDILEQMCDPVKNDSTEGPDPIKNDSTEGHDPIKNDSSILSKMTGKEEKEKNNKSGEEEEEKASCSSSNGEKEAAIWQAVLGELQQQVTKAYFDTWVRDTRLVSCQDGVFVIAAQSEFARDWLEDRLRLTVERVLAGIVGRPVEVRFVEQET